MRQAGKGGAGMRTKPGRLSFSPALPCVDCRELTTQGLIYSMSSQVWQLLPLCSKDMKESGPAGEEGDEQLRSSIAIAQGDVFIRTGNKLYCAGNLAK